MELNYIESIFNFRLWIKMSLKLLTFPFNWLRSLSRVIFFFDFLHADYQRIRNLDSEKSRFYLWHTNTHIHTRVPFNSPNGVYAGLTHLAVCNLIIRRDSCSLCSYTVTLFRSLSLFAVYYVVNAMRIQQQ